MKKQLSIAAFGIALSSSTFAQEPTPAPAAEDKKAPAAEEKKTPALSPEEIKSRTSYGIGYQNAFQLANAGLIASDFDKDAFFSGFQEALNGAELKYTPEQLDAAMQALQASLMERDKKIGEENLAKGKAFLEENAKKEGVKTTESGLQYIVLEKGGDKKYEAPKDAPNGMDMQSEFLVNYRGTLIDGTEFDKSPEGTPVPFTLQVVPGFAEALKAMPIGAKWKIFLPASLGYGERRQGAKLGPNSALIFEVELTEIRKRQMPQGMPFQLPPGAIPGQ
ncbi:FKBP-type peptidyl-prolyl cis-trans isomerase N-terminal domain-containing protein [Rubritalea tangerina]|uniref:Peptidyl-prolyl cis-trans isomerase n=1 Tax=Rubritalea tangerina TaxID=430798 RepID=A0ABW4Z6N0_9BACT